MGQEAGLDALTRMTILVTIDQKHPTFDADPTATTQNLMAHIGKKLTQGSVEGATMDLEGRHVCSWKVLEYDK